MPSVLILGPYRFFFFAGDHVEPPHVHVERDDCVAKFCLFPFGWNAVAVSADTRLRSCTAESPKMNRS